jgi:hypothetical protein
VLFLLPHDRQNIGINQQRRHGVNLLNLANWGLRQLHLVLLFGLDYSSRVSQSLEYLGSS